jgi:hypothetical protein
MSSCIDLVSPHRVIYPDAPNVVKMLGKPTTPAVYTPFSLIQIVELVIFLPLNMIPILGTPLFIIITGTRLAKLSHYRWLQLRGFNKQERTLEMRKLAWEDVWFGTVAMLLELIPVLSFFFLLTSAAGAGLQTARIENDRKAAATMDDVSSHEEGEHEEDAPPPYSDNV